MRDLVPIQGDKRIPLSEGVTLDLYLLDTNMDSDAAAPAEALSRVQHRSPNLPFSACSPQSSFPLNHLNQFGSAAGKPCSEWDG